MTGNSLCRSVLLFANNPNNLANMIFCKEKNVLELEYFDHFLALFQLVQAIRLWDSLFYRNTFSSVDFFNSNSLLWIPIEEELPSSNMNFVIHPDQRVYLRKYKGLFWKHDDNLRFKSKLQNSSQHYHWIISCLV